MAAGGAIVFFHAHPDDEAIFTGGTIARLSADGHRTVVVVATSGELGLLDAVHPGTSQNPLGAVREQETIMASAILGASRVEFLGYSDSGLAAMGEERPDGAFAEADIDEAADRLATILRDETASALVIYDDGGIYRHPDHVAVHHVGLAAAALAGVESVYEATVDREYLHFVETHLVGHALESLSEPGPVGVPTVLLSNTVDVRAVIAEKRAAISAHASQIPANADVMTMDDTTFAAVYGYEWYVRRGPAGVIDAISM